MLYVFITNEECVAPTNCLWINKTRIADRVAISSVISTSSWIDSEQINGSGLWPSTNHFKRRCLFIKFGWCMLIAHFKIIKIQTLFALIINSASYLLRLWAFQKEPYLIKAHSHSTHYSAFNVLINSTILVVA